MKTVIPAVIVFGYVIVVQDAQIVQLSAKAVLNNVKTVQAKSVLIVIIAKTVQAVTVGAKTVTPVVGVCRPVIVETDVQTVQGYVKIVLKNVQTVLMTISAADVIPVLTV